MHISVEATMLIHSGDGLLTTYSGSEWRAAGVGVVKRSGSLIIAQQQKPSEVSFELTIYSSP
jgi:hypothetical protein